MRETALWTIVLLVVFGASAARAFDDDMVPQQPEPKPKSESTFWGLDVFGGYSSLQASTGELNEAGEFVRAKFKGWGAGATARFLSDLPWLGITGSFSQNSRDEIRFRHYRAGLTVTGSYGGDYIGRGFLFAFLGSSTVSTPDMLSTNGFEVNAGGGIDMLGFVRLQFDWVRMNVPGYPANNFGFFVGGVLPLCFGGGDDHCLIAIK